jgi:hypothetical protein
MTDPIKTARDALDKFIDRINHLLSLPKISDDGSGDENFMELYYSDAEIVKAALDQVQNVGVDVEGLKLRAEKDMHEKIKSVGDTFMVHWTIDYLAAKGHLQTPVKGWMPIDTLKDCQDGMVFLARKKRDGKIPIVMAYKNVSGGWNTIEGGFERVEDATHWMPLPTPPATGKPQSDLDQIATVFICGQQFIVRRENHDAFVKMIGILEPATERTGDE